jgi:PAS domain S-box-containing protein
MSGPDGMCSYVNQPWLQFTGLTLDRVLGRGWQQALHAADLSRVVETVKSANDRRVPFQVEYRIRRHDGEYRWFFDQGVPRFNLDGSFAGHIGSAVDVTERKLAEEALSGMSRKLIEAQEEERTWLARELHDDINQRIAFLSVLLKRAIQELPDSAAAAKQQLEDLYDRAGALGLDVQALSHRLHSSKLDYLGLGTAAAGFCRELSDQHQVEVDFRSGDLPKDLPNEVSLCLFRVLQEALQNAAKHSGSNHFRVTLEHDQNEIRLLVEDSGKGFSPEEARSGRGVGLASMTERLKLVHGQLSISSRPGGGTVVSGRVPLGSSARTARAGM